MATFKSRSKEQTLMNCMNHNPATSRWQDWAPEGGCKNKVMVGSEVAKVLCSTCTLKTTIEPGEYRKDLR